MNWFKMVQNRASKGLNPMLFMTIAVLQVSAHWWMEKSAGLAGKILITWEEFSSWPWNYKHIIVALWS